MSNKKQYRLMKDTPGKPAGTIYTQHPRYANRWYPEDCYENGALIHDSASIYGVITADINNTDFFEEIIPPEPFKVMEIYYEQHLAKGHEYCFSATIPIPKEKYDSIKRAIEVVLNNESQIEQINHALLHDYELLKLQCQQAEKEAFDRSRVFEFVKNNIGGFEPKYMYPTFEDYKKSKS